jgi:hypothetical protein
MYSREGALMEEDEIISLLNQTKYFYLREISEPQDNSLRLVVEEAVEDRSETGFARDPASPLAEILKDAWPIESTDKSRSFEFHWNHYAAYLVTDEVVGSGGDHEDETYTGTLFRVYTKSHFLDYLARETDGHIEPILHYKLVCLNHLIDVASYRPPEVRLLNTSENVATKIRPN